MTPIADRPPEANDRAILGHWEGDLILGKKSESAIGTIVERRSGYVILVHIKSGKNRAEATRDGLIEKLTGLPDTLKGSLTWDQGFEMQYHKEITKASGIDIYFADPHSA